MNENFTGIDVERVDSDIKKAEESFDFVIKKCVGDVSDFMFTLSKNWASPKAISFGREFSDAFRELFDDYSIRFNHLMHGACEAAKSLCESNGIYDLPSTFNDFDFVVPGSREHLSSEIAYVDTGFDTISFVEAINGVSGMAKESVRFARDTFVRQMVENYKFSYVPTSISFYDSNGNLRRQYEMNLDTFYQDLADTTSTLVEKLNDYIDTEIENIMLASNSAETSMGSYSANA